MKIQEKIFYTSVYAFCTIFIFMFINDAVSKTLAINRFYRNYEYFKYLNHESNILYENDTNELKLEDILIKYCNVYLLNNTDICLNKLKLYDTNKYIVNFANNNQPIYYHTFWQIDETSDYEKRALKLNILSYLATQNLTHTRFILWTLKKFKIEDELKLEFKKYFQHQVIEIRLLDLSNLCLEGIFFWKYKSCADVHANQNFIGFSDFVRFLVLYNYGGIYVDGDVLFLRDMRPFWNKNFFYRWSYAVSYNTAIMGFQRQHNLNIEKIYERILYSYSTSMVNGFHPWSVKNIIQKDNMDIFNYEDLSIYHSALFDPAWLCFDGVSTLTQAHSFCNFKDFYTLNVTKHEFEIKGFFKGAFAYHQHYGSYKKCKYQNNSYVFHIENFFRSKLTHFTDNK